MTDADAAVDDDDSNPPSVPSGGDDDAEPGEPGAPGPEPVVVPTLPPRDPRAVRDEPVATPSLPRLQHSGPTAIGEPEIPQPRPERTERPERAGRAVRSEAGPHHAEPAERAPRPSRWDRPPEPHDWRFYVGTLGRVLIAVGVLMFGFVGYQLWGTGIETARAQSHLEDEFDRLVAQAGGTVSTAPVGDAPATGSPGVTSPTTEPPTRAPSATLAPAPDVPPTAPVVAEGEPLAKLEIPAIDETDIVVPGVDHESLKKGPGHYPDTPLPGQLGNAAIAGHRTTWSEPFARIDELEPGDEIIVTMTTGARFVYVVDSTEIVSPSDYWIVGTTDPTVAQLTLTSCHPRWSATQRIAVKAFLAPDVSSPVGQPTFYDLDDADDADAASQGTATPTIPGDDPSATSSPATSPATSPTTAPAGTSTGTIPGATVPGAPPADSVPSIATPVDGLTEGWFNDSGAWLHILLWGLLCAAIARVAFLISRRLRSYPIGWTISLLPFLFALYFLYQNINRLLPPGL